jgi:hypothetical protein
MPRLLGGVEGANFRPAGAAAGQGAGCGLIQDVGSARRFSLEQRVSLEQGLFECRGEQNPF